MARGTTTALAAMLIGSCGHDPFPADFPEAWTEARVPCTLSHDHDLTYIRVWADDLAADPYRTFEAPYPEGARLLKAMYRDDTCEQMIGFVTMEKLAEGSSPDTLDWDWRRFDARGRERVDARRIPSTCVDCHAWHCGELPYGWDSTCSQDGLEPPGPPPGS